MDSEYIVYKAKVVSVDDKSCGMRIKVRLGGIDGNLTDKELPDCFPFLPKLIHVMPKVDECVLVILEKGDAGKSNRYFIGPILSQPYLYEQELYETSAMNLLPTEQKKEPLPHPDEEARNKGTLPDINDIALLGRENTDIVLKPNEIRLRCGYKQNPTGPVKERLFYNRVNPAYIQMRYENMGKFNSVINIVADRINLIHNDARPKYDDQLGRMNPYQNKCAEQDLIDDSDLYSIMEQAQSLVYGDMLINFLKKFIDVFRRHTHSFSMKPPALNQPDQKLLETNLDAMLCNEIQVL